MTEGKKYNPEITFRAGKKENTYYVYVNDYTIEQLEDFVTQAKATLQAATPDGNGRTAAGSVVIQILGEEDQKFYTERRKFKYAPDARLQYLPPKEDATKF